MPRPRSKDPKYNTTTTLNVNKEKLEKAMNSGYIIQDLLDQALDTAINDYTGIDKDQDLLKLETRKIQLTNELNDINTQYQIQQTKLKKELEDLTQSYEKNINNLTITNKELNERYTALINKANVNIIDLKERIELDKIKKNEDHKRLLFTKIVNFYADPTKNTDDNIGEIFPLTEEYRDLTGLEYDELNAMIDKELAKKTIYRN